MRLASIVGSRPQFIKLAPVSYALRQWHEEIIIHTGQHYDYEMSAQFFHETEWAETVEAGWNVLVGSDCHAIIEAIGRSMPKPPRQNPFGEGDAAIRIAQDLSCNELGARNES